MNKKQAFFIVAVGVLILVGNAIGYIVDWNVAGPVWTVLGVVFLGAGLTMIRKS